MIHFFYYQLKEQMPAATYARLLATLAAAMQEKISKFRNWQDAERSLAGQLLLMRGLQQLNLPLRLSDLQLTEFQKPYFNHPVSFNISHSGDFVICAISETAEVGIDIEAIRPIPLEDFTNLFTPFEWQEVVDATDQLAAFYTLWTKKEAFLKVIGCGLSQPLNTVEIKNNAIQWEGNHWFLHKIALDANHITYLCTNQQWPTITVAETTF